MSLLAALAVGGGGVVIAQPNPGGKQTDPNADPLPAGALARFGTLRWRHAEAVTYVAFLPDGKVVLTGSTDRTLRLWDRATGKEIRRFTLPVAEPMALQAGRVLRFPGGVTAGQVVAALSSDGKTLAAAVANNAVQVWDVDTGKEIRQIKGPPNGIGSLIFTPNGKALAMRGADQTIHLMATDSGNEIRQIKKDQQAGVRVAIGGRFGDTSGMAFSPDGKLVATSENEFDQAQQMIKTFVRICEVDTGKEVRRIDAAPNGASALAFAPSGKVLAFAIAAEVRLADPADGSEIARLVAPTGASSLVFTPDSKLILGKARDQTVQVWDAETGKALRQLGDAVQNVAGVNLAILRFAGFGDAQNLAVTADGKTVATGAGNTIRLWEVGTGKEHPLAGGHRGPISAIGVTRDGKTLVSRGADNVIRCWNLADSREIGQFQEPAATLTAAFSPDGRTLAFGGSDGAIRLVDCMTGKPKTQFKGHAGGTGALIYAPDGTTLASVGANGNAIMLHDAATGDVRRQIVLQEPNAGGGAQVIIRGPISFMGGPSFVFAPDGKTLVGQFPANNGTMLMNAPGGAPAAAPNTQIRLWDVATGKEVRKFTLPGQHGVGSISLSPDGRVLASENADGTVSHWELASGQERSQFGKAEVAQAAPAPQAPFAVAQFIGPAAAARPRTAANTVAFSPDGNLLAFKGPARSIRVWDVATSKEIGSFPGHDGTVTALAFTPDGHSLATGSSDTTMLLWNVSSLPRPASPPSRQVTAKELTALFDDLLGDDARKAFVSIRWLTEGAEQAVPFLREHCKPAVPPDPKKLARLIAQLDSDDFEERNGANEELARLGDLAVPALQKLAASQGTLEARRRVEVLLLRLTGGALTREQVRTVRVVEVLERTATADARQLLDALAKGAPGALATREAQAALERLAKSR
jgi:WD40 repeat protein